MHYKHLIIGALAILSFNSYSAQSSTPFCVPDRFGNDYIFATGDIVIQSDIEYGLSQTIDGTWEPQLMDIYTVDPVLDTMTHRPLAIVLHGGGFRSGDKTDNLVVESMMALARSGYTAATFNYRLGYDEPAGDCSADGDDIRRAAYRALQDANAAMRFLFHYQDEYGIDTSFVFAGGVSVGATLASLLHYGTAEYFSENFNFLPLELGPINTSGNALEDEFHVDGLIMVLGSLPPFLDITADNAIPMVVFHGALDEVVPVGEGTFNSCPDYPITIGPDVYIPELEEAGVCYDYNRNPEGEHSADIYTEFYIKNRTMCFMKSLMCDECESSQQEQASPLCPELGALSLSEFESADSFLSIVPNPTRSDNLCIRSDKDVNQAIDIRVLDLQGKELLQVNGVEFISNSYCLENLFLESGYYFLDIRTAQKGLGTISFIIE